MVDGAPEAARWVRPEPRRSFPPELIERMVRAAFPRGSVTAVEAPSGGLRNPDFKIQVDCAREPVVLRIYEHDPSLCQKEVDLIGLVQSIVPVTEVLHAEPLASPPFTVARYVEGITFRELRRIGNRDAIAQA